MTRRAGFALAIPALHCSYALPLLGRLRRGDRVCLGHCLFRTSARAAQLGKSCVSLINQLNFIWSPDFSPQIIQWRQCAGTKANIPSWWKEEDIVCPKQKSQWQWGEVDEPAAWWLPSPPDPHFLNGCRQYLHTLEMVLLQANEAATPFSLVPYLRVETVNLGKKWQPHYMQGQA